MVSFENFVTLCSFWIILFLAATYFFFFAAFSPHEKESNAARMKNTLFSFQELDMQLYVPIFSPYFLAPNTSRSDIMFFFSSYE